MTHQMTPGKDPTARSEDPARSEVPARSEDPAQSEVPARSEDPAQSDDGLPVSTVATIHLDRLRTNVQAIRARIPGLEMMGVVKADAYGHGSVAVSRTIADMGIESLGVATVAEGIHLRMAGLSLPITVFAPPLADRIKHYDEFDLDIIVDSDSSLSILEKSGIRAKCHLKVDTGMSRLGQTPADSKDLLHRIEAGSRLSLDSVWTHFARADEPDEEFTSFQLRLFEDFIDSLGGAPAPLHVAASAAVFAHPNSIDPARYSMARIGIALYGLLDLPGQPPPEGLQPIMEFTSRVSAIKRVKAGTPVSYGARWRAPSDTYIATISAGYADGVQRNLVNRGSVRIGKAQYPIRGTVCMDMFMVDIGDNEGQIEVGDAVTVFGSDAPTAFDIARQAETITYVVSCAVSPRVRRCYLDS